MHIARFYEFCWALNEGPLIPYIKNCFEKKIPMKRNIHDKAMLIKQYLLVGGMPMSIVAFLEGQNILRRQILKSGIFLNFTTMPS